VREDGGFMENELNHATETVRAKLDGRLRRTVALHFDTKNGSPYWLEREQELGIDEIQQIRSIDDLAVLGPMQSDQLALRPVEDFIPKSILPLRKGFLYAETGGTLAEPKFAVHRRDEFKSAFVDPFVEAARMVRFPTGENWLFVGPTGPHVIGKAAVECAKALESPEPFCVDFDPRWAKKLPEGSYTSSRYLNHIESQALRVIETQRIGVIFSTPRVLESLATKIDSATRSHVYGLHLGGMSVSREFRITLKQLFPQAVILSGYGNTLFGMVPEIADNIDSDIDYYPHGNRAIFTIVDNKNADLSQRIRQQVAYGERGQVMVHRLDETQFIANMLERDTAIRLKPPVQAKHQGFVLDGLRNPEPLINKSEKPAIGLY
jgi:hypothetical protein